MVLVFALAYGKFKHYAAKQSDLAGAIEHPANAKFVGEAPKVGAPEHVL
jgi:hypothetical protein